MGQYLVGKLICEREQVQSVVDAVNYLRCVDGVRVACIRASWTDDGKAIVPLLYRGPKEFVDDEIDGLLDIGKVSWSRFSPRASDSKSLKMARIIAASIAMKGEIPIDSIVPDEAVDSFASLYGLDKQKSRIKRMADAIAAFGEDALECRNLIFKGAPGTGKTSAGRAFATYCYQRGVTRTPVFIAVSAADLIGSHVGETPKLVRQAFDRAEGGVLFIDEAPSLTYGPTNPGNEFAPECVNALNEAMDRLRSRVMVVAAGYPSEMELFLASNSGLSSRFSYEVVFPDYTDKELVEIYRGFCAMRGFEVNGEAGSFLCEKVGSLRQLEGFANGRTVRKLYDASVLSAAQCHPQLRIITRCDLEWAFAELAPPASTTRFVGFV